MIEYQMFVWISFFIIGSLASYIILECKSKYLFVTTILFSVLIGFATSYLWLLMTGGLDMYNWALIILPTILSSFSTIIYLSYYKAYHPRLTFPKRPRFITQRLTGSMALVGVILSVVSLVMFSLPSGGPAPAIATLGSSGITTTTADEVAQTPLSTDSLDIKIQSSVVGLTTMRNNPRQREYLNFKVEFDPSYPYNQPSLKVFVQDENGELIPESDIISYTTADNMLEGQIYCGTAGIYNLTVAAYDQAVSTVTPMATNTLSYTVYGLFNEDPAIDNVYIIMLATFLSLILFLMAIILLKKHL